MFALMFPHICRRTDAIPLNDLSIIHIRCASKDFYLHLPTQADAPITKYIQEILINVNKTVTSALQKWLSYIPRVILLHPFYA
jgi:hypothetical protein